MHAAITLSSSPNRSGTDATTSRTTRPMATNETAATTHPSSPIWTRSRMAVIGAPSRLYGASCHAALEIAASEIAASEIAEAAGVASHVPKHSTVAGSGVPGREVAALGAGCVGGRVGGL